MLHTTLCDLLGIEIPIIQAPLGPWSTPELTAAVSNSGAIGSLGTVLLAPGAIRAQVRRIHELTDRPFIMNFSQRAFSEVPDDGPVVAGPSRSRTAISATATARWQEPCSPGGQDGARGPRSADRGVDAIIAQGTESSGCGGTVTCACCRRSRKPSRRCP
jgi:nitronate monooxygenase/enoyl-[acyl-carrier protein] reductase II